MPARIAVHLAPAHHPRPVPPPQTGPAVHAALLKAIDESGLTKLATALHEARSPKPYALTPLLDERGMLATQTSKNVRFVVGVLADQLTAPLMHALMETAVIRIARCHYRVTAPELVAAVSYENLATQPRTCWRLLIHTPAAFGTAREEGVRRDRPFPEPEWVFDSLYRRWNAFTQALPEDVRIAVHRHMEITDCRLTIAEHMVKAGQPSRRGSIGEITYRLAEADKVPPDVRTGVDALMRYAEYAGIGDRTAVGMGHVSLSPATTPTPDAKAPHSIKSAIPTR